jgi:CheY-like chemotaxis protein/predicted regulator of Ras-like GTPase activity (Roadblock/LC7/MglB family)
MRAALASPAMAAANTGKRRRIVLVDDEEALAWSLANRLTRARADVDVETAHDGEPALALLAQRPADLLIADVRMPRMSGIDLVLAARQTAQDLPVIVMTAFKTADLSRVTGGSATSFLEKPFAFERLLELVDRALAPKVGFSGAISVQTLPDVVQLYVLSSSTGMLRVREAGGEGCLWFERGAILHATAPGQRGEDAFYEIMMWSGGEFSMHAGEAAPERTVRASWQELLMESCRRLDERRRVEGPPRERTGWTETPPVLPSADDWLDQFDFSVGQRVPDLTVPTPVGVVMEVTMNIKDSLAKLNQIDGFVGAALVDSESGMLLGQEGGGSLNLEVAAAGNTEVVRAKRKTMSSLNLKEAIEDILITLGKQYHLIRPLRSRSTLFFYVALDRSRANLAMARIALADVEKELQV